MKVLNLSSGHIAKTNELKRARHEFNTVQRLQKNDVRNITLYYDFQEDKKWINSRGRSKLVSYILMEYVEGITLDKLAMRAGGIPEKALLYIFKKIIKILMSLHANGIAHCDIKPENILINSEGEVNLIDFGFAAELQSIGFK